MQQNLQHYLKEFYMLSITPNLTEKLSGQRGPLYSSPVVNNLLNRINENRNLIDDLKLNIQFQNALILMRQFDTPHERIADFLSGNINLNECFPDEDWIIDLLVKNYIGNGLGLKFLESFSDSNFLCQSLIDTFSTILRIDDFESSDITCVKLNTLINAIRKSDASSLNLEGVTLPQAMLFKANLSNANLSNANLAGANLIGANLSKAKLSNANLIGARFFGPRLRNDRSLDYSNCNFGRIPISRTCSLASSLLACNANLDGAILTGAKSDDPIIRSLIEEQEKALEKYMLFQKADTILLPELLKKISFNLI